MGTPQQRTLIVAGEASGDMRAAGLVAAAKAMDPSIHFAGIGGQCMRTAGVEILADIDQLGVVGVWDVIKHLPVIKRTYDLILKYVAANPVNAAILVDYPGFNLKLAAALKTKGIKVIYYVSPQVWAWKEKRIIRIKQIVDRMLVLFPFEKDIYAKYSMDVDYVGHPLLDEVKVSEPPASIKASLGINPLQQTIGLMPGSRAKEISRHLPVMLDAAKILLTKNPNRRFILPKATTISRNMLDTYINASNIPVIVYEGPVYNGISAMDAAIIASGTATLETGLLLKPMIIMYKTAWLTYWLAKQFIKIPYIGLVNVVAGKKIINEYIQNDATAENLAQGIEDILSTPNAYAQITNDLAQMKKSLGHAGANARAAAIVIEELKKQQKPVG